MRNGPTRIAHAPASAKHNGIASGQGCPGQQRPAISLGDETAPWLVDERDVRLLSEFHHPLEPPSYGNGQRRLNHPQLTTTYTIAEEHKNIGVVGVT
jgi:hypothetical protein